MSPKLHSFYLFQRSKRVWLVSVLLAVGLLLAWPGNVVLGQQQEGTSLRVPPGELKATLDDKTADIRVEDVPPPPDYPFARYVKVPPMVYGGLKVEVSSRLDGIEVPKARPDTKASQTILVLGREIRSGNGEYKLESADKSIRYVYLAAKDPDHRLRYSGSLGPGRNWEDLFSQAVEGVPREFRELLGHLDAILIRAEMDGGVTGGFKHLILNGHKVDWFLDKGTSTAELRFVRDLPQRGTEATTHLFLWDAFRLEIRTSDPIPASELPIKIFTGEQQLNVSGAPIVAKREPADPLIFRTGPIFVDIPGTQNAFRKQYASSITPQRGTVLTALTGLDDEFVSPPVGRVRIESDPTELRVSWQNALNEAQRLAGMTPTASGSESAQSIATVSNLIWTEFGSRKVNVTIGHLAAMLLLRRTFMRQMEAYLEEMPQDPAKFPLDRWRAELAPYMRDPNFPVGNVEVTPVGALAFPLNIKEPFYRSFDKAYLAFTFRGFYGREQDWIREATIEAYRNWRNAVLDSLEIARNTKTYSPQAMVELTGSGFEPVAAMLKPLLVKQEQIAGQPGYRWVPDVAARDYVDAIPYLASEIRANHQLAAASRNVVLTTASLTFFGPASLATRIIGGAVVAGFSFEAGSVLGEYANSQDELKFARGATAVLSQDRLEIAQIREISGLMPVLSVIGAAVGFGGETFAWLAHIGRSQALARGTKLLANLRGDTFKAFASLSKEDQAAVLTLISEARMIRQNPVGSLTGVHRKALEIGAEIERKTRYKSFLHSLDIAELPGFRSAVTIAESEFRTGTNLVAKQPQPGMPTVGSEFSFINEQGELQKAVLEKLIGRGRYAHVYTIKDQPSRVLKIYRDVEGWLDHVIDGEPTRTWGITRSATDSVETSLRLSKMIEKKGISQLKILSSDAKAQRPYTVQERLSGDMVRFNYALEETAAGDRIIGLEGGKKLSRSFQQALLRLFKKFASGNDPLIWEDSHIENVYFFRNARNEWEAGVLDQDRIARWNALKEEPKTFPAVQRVMDTPGVQPCRIYSLSKFTRPANDEALLLAGTPTFPSADFFMEKALELGGRYIKFNLETRQFEDFILDMRIVEEPEFFPNIRRHVDIDLSQVPTSGR